MADEWATSLPLPSRSSTWIRTRTVANRYPREQDHRSSVRRVAFGPGQSRSGKCSLSVNSGGSPDGGPAGGSGATVEARGPAASLEPAQERNRRRHGNRRQDRKRRRHGNWRQGCGWRDHSNRWHTGSGGTAETGGATVLGGSPATGGAASGEDRNRRTAAIAGNKRTSETGGMLGTGGSVGAAGAVSWAAALRPADQSELAEGPAALVQPVRPRSELEEASPWAARPTPAPWAALRPCPTDTVKQRMLLPHRRRPGDELPRLCVARTSSVCLSPSQKALTHKPILLARSGVSWRGRSALTSVPASSTSLALDGHPSSMQIWRGFEP